MTQPKASLAERLSRLQALRSAPGQGTTPDKAELLIGDWPNGCQAFPASYAQARLWFLQQLQPNLTAYHLPAFWKLKGALDFTALVHALSALLERHPTLRTSFQLHGSEVVQILHPPAPVRLESEPLGARDLDTVIQSWLQEEAATPFDLASGLLLRARLLAIAEQEHVLLINHHHIASDGWSCSILSRDLTELYNAHRNGQPPQLQPLKVHYQDYAAWQRQRLSGDHLQALKDYWIPQLTGLEPLELPTDHPRPATPSHQGASHAFCIEPALLAPFEELCRSEGATLQMGLLALLALLLHRYSRQDDFAIGIPIWGRNHPDLEPLIGFFINTLPIRTRFSTDLSFRQLLQQVKTTSINAYDHQELPFEQMVETLNLQRDTSRNPLVQVMLQLIELPAPSLSNLDGLAVEPIPSSTSTSRLELEFFLRRDSNGGLDTTLVYATDLFCADRIQRLSGHLLTLLASAAQAPDLPAASLNLLPESELQLIQSWQHGPMLDLPDLCVHQLFEQQVERTPDAIALIFEDQQLSYRELNTRADQLAHQLLGLGVGPDVIVAVCLERSVELIVALLAILKAGGAYLPLDPAWPQERRQKLLDQVSKYPLVLVAVHGAVSGSSQQSIRHIRIQSLSRSAPSGQIFSQTEGDLDAVAYLLFTSGSTGTPKGVVIEHRALACRLRSLGKLAGLSVSTRILGLTSPVFDISLLELIVPLGFGATIVLASNLQRQDSNLLQKLIEDQKVDIVQSTPSVLKQLTTAGADLPKISTILVGGEQLEEGLAEILLGKCRRLVNVYGPTEATIWCSSALIGHSRAISIGKPLEGVSVQILCAGQPCPIGIPGELHIGGSGLARGYLNNPELTAAKFIPDPFSDNPSARLYKSGDLASWNSDGTLAFHGRIDQQIKLRGFRIEPGEIEANLLAHPGVAQVAVVLRRDDPANPRLIAYWVAQPSTVDGPSADQLRSFLAGRLPDYMLPSAFVALEVLPLTTNGKLDRKALPAPSFAGEPSQRVAPSTDLERQLHAIWAEVLGHADFGINDNFWIVGGHSLAAARLAVRIEKATGHALPLTALFQNPSIAALASVLLSSGVPPQTHGSISSLTERLSRLQALRSSTNATTIPAAEPVAGDWPQGCQAFPASYAQARLWFLQQLQPNLTAYHLPAFWKLRGELDVHTLSLALFALIERHSTLRTSFQLQGQDVLQILHQPASFPLKSEPLDDRDLDTVIQSWLQEEAATPFDLASGLLLRARLLAVDEQEHVLLINHHHIASDGWSCSILSRDLTELYNAHRNGQPPQLQPLKVHYQDYAAWQRQRLSGDHLQALKDYWIPQLTGLEPLELPTDHPRPATPSHQGASHAFCIEPALLAPFEELCRSEGVTLQMGLLALLALLLHRYSCQNDFAIGIPIWGRNHPDLEPLIGFFINTLPIRTRFSTDLSFRQLLQQVKTTSINAYDHQELPFEQMVEALNLERDTSRNPLVQVMLQLIELPTATLSNLDGLAVEPIQSSTTASRFDLEFFLRRDSNGGLNTTLVYATDLFCADRIQRLSSHLLTLLASAAQAPDLPAASLNLLPETERQLIESWQCGPCIEVPDLCVHQLFEQQVERTPDAIALIFEDQQLTYSQLNARADQLAHQLLGLGVGPDVIVAVCLERSVELIVALLAILKAGGAYLPLDPSWPQERHALLLAESGCAVLISADSAQRFRVPATATPAPALRPLAYISYTSGSTGTPKGVAIEHQAILRLVDPINGFRLGNGAAMLQLAPVAFDAATFEIWGPLLHGGTLVLAPPGTPSLAKLAACLNQHRITTLWLTAGLFHAMVDAELESLAGVPQVLAGGDVLHPASVQRLLAAFPSGHALINGYGPTENTTFTCCQRLGSDAPLTTDDVPIGSPIANTTVRVLDPSGSPCPIGIPGELHIGGSGLARGYLNNPELTAQKFIPDPFSDDPSARLYKSGDLVSWNPDGTLAFHGRIDQQIKLRGFRIEPGEIEANLLAHPDVAQAAVVLRRDDPANPRLIAYWVAQQRDSCAETSASELRCAEQLRAFLAERLPDYMVPSALVALPALPLTTNGKLDRRALPAPSLAGDLSQLLEPSTDLERQLHAIWFEVLGHSDFGITDNFWLVGGHSLAAAGLVSRIQQTLGRSIPVEGIFRCPTIREQANWLLEPSSQSPSQSTGHLVSLQPMGSRPPLHVVHGWGGRVGGFTSLARALAPYRPVLGLQASAGGSPPQGASVIQLADAYADEILASHQGGPIHLMGYSAGGWYAYAVAAALLQRGASLGMVAIVDTTATTRIHRRLGMALFGAQVGSRLLPALRSTLRQPRGQRRRRYALARLRSLNQAARLYLRMGVPGPNTIKDKLRGIAPPLSDPYVQLLYDGYRPPRLPLRVDVFATPRQLPKVHTLWSFYAQGGVNAWPLFDRHSDFIKPELASQLAEALETALQRAEGTQPAPHIPVMQ
jgi:amino acid adenylation domain-containing protein